MTMNASCWMTRSKINSLHRTPLPRWSTCSSVATALLWAPKKCGIHKKHTRVFLCLFRAVLGCRNIDSRLILAGVPQDCKRFDPSQGICPIDLCHGHLRQATPSRVLPAKTFFYIHHYRLGSTTTINHDKNSGQTMMNLLRTMNHSQLYIIVFF